MCLGIPMKISKVHEDGTGEVELDGALSNVDLSLVEQPSADEYVIVHAGFAIEKLDMHEANSRLELFKELAETINEKEQA